MTAPAPLSRRHFLQLAAGSIAASSGKPRTVSIVVDPNDAVAAGLPVKTAVQALMEALATHGIALRHFASIQQSPNGDFCIVASGPERASASETLQRVAIQAPRSRESLALAKATFEGRAGVLACGADSRGLMYALLELSDRVLHADDPVRALQPEFPVVEQPSHALRSVGRLFVSQVEDKPWFDDRQFWPPYLAMLATQRFNRLQLALGIGYDSLQSVTDSYLLFAYPFLIATPGYSVRALGLPEAERERNLQTLQFISSQAVAHGLDFQLGIWTHGYRWGEGSRANYTIQGLSPENHAVYSRDSLSALLRACPAISGVTLRTHGESGVREGSYAFWKTVFEGVAQCGRKVEIDLHTKGLDWKMIDAALGTGMPVRLSPKYWAEHLGLPYHQTSIRELEMPREHANPEDFSALSTGSRSFTRYGYADFLREDRRYALTYRVWPGTHRFLLWGDPEGAAAHSRAFRFCGADGAELFEPLSFKGRRGSGIAGGRCAYADRSLQPRWDWEKYRYTYRVWGRLLYNPDADPDTWRRYLRKQFQNRAPAFEAALASASRILPTVTATHLPSAANDTYVPEFYTNQPIADATAPHPYGDTPSPKVFGNVSPLDPQLFSSSCEFVEELVSGQHSARYAPPEVAQWLEELAEAASHELTHWPDRGNPEARRLLLDIRIQVGLGRFFAAKLRSASLYCLHTRLGNRAALEHALVEYRRARDIWSEFAHSAGAAYASDVTVGPLPHQRGHWRDRLPAIEADLATMARQLQSAGDDSAHAAQAVTALRRILNPSRPAQARCRHEPASHYVADEPLQLTLAVSSSAQPPPAVRLHYRHVNQAEDYQTAAMLLQGGEYHASVPAAYLAPTYPLEYFFEVLPVGGRPFFYPGLDRDRLNQPYFLVPPRARG